MKYDRNNSTPEKSKLDKTQIEKYIKEKILVFVKMRGKSHWFFISQLIYVRSDRDSKYIFLSSPSYVLTNNQGEAAFKKGKHILKLARCSFEKLQAQIGPDIIRVHDKYAVMRPMISQRQIDFEHYTNWIKKAKELWKNGTKLVPRAEIVFRTELFDDIRTEADQGDKYSNPIIPSNWKIHHCIPVSEKYADFAKYLGSVYHRKWWLGEI